MFSGLPTTRAEMVRGVRKAEGNEGEDERILANSLIDALELVMRTGPERGDDLAVAMQDRNGNAGEASTKVGEKLLSLANERRSV